MERLLKRSSFRFASAMSSIMEKYNLPFDNDLLISIKSLTYDTPEGPKVWGEESSNEITKSSDQYTVQCQENTETQIQQISESEDENYEDYESSEEEQSMNLYEEKQLENTDLKSYTDLAFIKRCLENTHIKKENIPPVCCYETPEKNKYRVEMDVLLGDCASSVPKLLTITRTKANNVCQGPPLQDLEGESLTEHNPVALRKQVHDTNKHPASLSLQLYDSSSPVSAAATTVARNQSLWGNNETDYSRFVEMYESADEQCSWSDVTIADLYPGMVKSLSKLMHKVSYKASSSSFIKQYRYGYWHPRKTKLNTTIERVSKFRPLKLKSSFSIMNCWKRDKLPMANNESPFDDSKHQIQCSVNNVTSVVSSTYPNVERMDNNSSGIVESHSYMERARQYALEATVPCELSTEETFLVSGPSCIFSSSDCIKRGQHLDSGPTLHLAEGGRTNRMNDMTFKTTSCLNLSLNSSTNSYLQKDKFSPVKTSNRLLGNHDIKRSSTATSLQRSHSFSSLPVNWSPIKAHQKCEDAFEKMYKELCSPKPQKPLEFPNTCISPRKSTQSCMTVFNSSSKTCWKPNDTFDSIYQKLCLEGFPKIPALLRAANLKKYEGIQMSETVNALINSPIRTVPAVARIKRAANFCNEGIQSSPLKRLKNTSENSYRLCQKPLCWKNVDLQKTDRTFTLHTPNANNWISKKLDSGFHVSSDHTFQAESRASMQASRIEDICECIPESLQSCGSLRKAQNYPRGFSRKPSHNDS